VDVKLNAKPKVIFLFQSTQPHARRMINLFGGGRSRQVVTTRRLEKLVDDGAGRFKRAFAESFLQEVRELKALLHNIFGVSSLPAEREKLSPA
jgi:hypothetical protein